MYMHICGHLYIHTYLSWGAPDTKPQRAPWLGTGAGAWLVPQAAMRSLPGLGGHVPGGSRYLLLMATHVTVVTVIIAITMTVAAIFFADDILIVVVIIILILTVVLVITTIIAQELGSKIHTKYGGWALALF